MNDIAETLWNNAVTHLNAAEEAEEINIIIVETGMGELALKMAQFAFDHPVLVGGYDEAGIPYATPPGAVRGPADEIPKPGPNTPAPQPPSAGPIGGPKLWGQS